MARAAALCLLALVSACASRPTGTSPVATFLPPVTGRTVGTSTNGICMPPAPPTPAQTEGPYFKAGSPERTSLLEPGMAGTKLVLSGVVLTQACQPVAGASLDFWQADASGQYDNSGYNLRGHQVTDASGHYQLITIVPGLYPGRTEHIHVKVQAPGGPLLTTQLYFPGVTQNESDGIFDPALVMAVQSTSDGETATFNFVISLK